MTLINGIEYSWTNVRLTIAGVPFFGVEEINYQKKQEKKNNYGIGSEVVSRSYGIAEYELSLSLHMSDVQAIRNAAPNKDITKIPPFDIVVAYVDVQGRAPVIHKLRGCEFMNDETKTKVGDEKITVSLDMILSGIEY